MTITSTVNFKEYEANGIATRFAIPFLLLARNDLNVYLDNQPYAKSYTITGLGNPIGEIVFDEAPKGRLLLQRYVEPIRETDYQNNGDLLAKTVNEEFDRIYMMMQDKEQNLDQALRVVDAKGINPLPFAEDRAGKLLSFDENGEPIVTLASTGSVEEFQQHLASAKGSGLIGFNELSKYETQTVGNELKSLRLGIEFVKQMALRNKLEIDDLKENKERFVILYPNGGTKENPAKVKKDTTYVVDNPFPEKSVICILEVLHPRGIWGETGWFSSGGGYGVYAGLAEYSNNNVKYIPIQVGAQKVVGVSNYAGNPFHDNSTQLDEAPCRLKVYRIED